MHPLGSGSDYTVFLDHLGVPALDIGFSGRYGVYHSIYDDFNWMEKFGDPEFLTHAMAARLYTVLVMRAAGGRRAAVPVRPLRRGPARSRRRAPADPGTAGARQVGREPASRLGLGRGLRGAAGCW